MKQSLRLLVWLFTFSCFFVSADTPTNSDNSSSSLSSPFAALHLSGFSYTQERWVCVCFFFSLFRSYTFIDGETHIFLLLLSLFTHYTWKTCDPRRLGFCFACSVSLALYLSLSLSHIHTYTYIHIHTGGISFSHYYSSCSWKRKRRRNSKEEKEWRESRIGKKSGGFVACRQHTYQPTRRRRRRRRRAGIDRQ